MRIAGVVVASLAMVVFSSCDDDPKPCVNDQGCAEGQSCQNGYCGPGTNTQKPGRDGGATDAGSVDAGAVDAGSADAGASDAGPIDAGAPDAGPSDAGVPDAGPIDAGVPDAGTPDAGPERVWDKMYWDVGTWQ